MLVYIYMVLSIILGVSAMFSGAIYAGISGIIGSNSRFGSHPLNSLVFKI
jgi:hypothetical protein